MSQPGQQSPQDAVKATSSLADGIRQQMEQTRKNPEQELGMTAEELERRRAEATTPRKVTSGVTNRDFEVKSSTRAQQIMNKGINKMQREKKKRELKDSMKILRKFQVVLSIFGVMFIAWIGVEFLLPQYAAVQERQRRMKVRYERAQASLAEAAKDGSIDPAALSRPGFVVVTRKTKDGQAIQ